LAILAVGADLMGEQRGRSRAHAKGCS
jgi:hypothetical protein